MNKKIINDLKKNLYNKLRKHWETIESDCGKTFIKKDTNEFGFFMKFIVIGQLNKDDVDKDITDVVVSNNLTNDFAEYEIKTCQNYKFNNTDLELKYGKYYTLIKIIIRNITK